MKRKDNEYSYIQPQVDNKRKKKKRKKKKGGFGKVLLVIIALLVILIAGGLVFVKYIFTDFYFSEVLPNKEVADFVDENIIGRTTTTTTQPRETTTEPTTLSQVSYLDHSDFEFEASKKGGMIGNLLNGGKVEKDNGIVYHIVDGRGIYKFLPDSESYACVYKSSDILSSFNIRGDYFYFVNESDNSLYKITMTGKNLAKVAENVKLAYIYDTTAYCLSTNNEVLAVNTQDFTYKVLYSGYGDKVNLIGISLDRVFFTSEDMSGNVAYFCVLSTGGEEERFRPDSKNGEIASMTMESGFMYYYEKQSDGKYNIIRQKYGSQKTVTLVEGVSLCKPVVVDQNRMFYADLDGDKFKMFEFNMNSEATKMMLYSGNVTAGDDVSIQHGGEYDFIIGERSNGDKIYRASSNLTGSSNVMTFGNGKWSY